MKPLRCRVRLATIAAMESQLSAERRRALVARVIELAATESDPDGRLDELLGDLEARIGRFAEKGGRSFGLYAEAHRRREEHFDWAGVYGALIAWVPRLRVRAGSRAARSSFIGDMKARFDLDVARLFEKDSPSHWETRKGVRTAADEMLKLLMGWAEVADWKAARALWVEGEKARRAWIAWLEGEASRPKASYLDRSPVPAHFAKGKPSFDRELEMMHDLRSLFGPLPVLDFGRGITIREDPRTGRARAFSGSGPVE